jgi:cupin 2 domain-containing protein
MDTDLDNLFFEPDGRMGEEQAAPLLAKGKLRIEKIFSHGRASSPDFWYDQPEDEWVALLRGTATLKFEDGTIRRLAAGDYLVIERHMKHRVEETSPDAVWLAVHYD